MFQVNLMCNKELRVVSGLKLTEVKKKFLQLFHPSQQSIFAQF